MAHPDISKARDAERDAHKDFLVRMRRVRDLVGLNLGSKVPIQPSELRIVENAIDDLKSSIVFLANARALVDLLEDS